VASSSIFLDEPGVLMNSVDLFGDLGLGGCGSEAKRESSLVAAPRRAEMPTHSDSISVAINSPLKRL
jgi:hypothetical protein